MSDDDYLSIDGQRVLVLANSFVTRMVKDAAARGSIRLSAPDKRAASEAWSAGVRAAVKRLEEERKDADARRLGWDPELTGGEE